MPPGLHRAATKFIDSTSSGKPEDLAFQSDSGLRTWFSYSSPFRCPRGVRAYSVRRLNSCDICFGYIKNQYQQIQPAQSGVRPASACIPCVGWIAAIFVLYISRTTINSTRYLNRYSQPRTLASGGFSQIRPPRTGRLNLYHINRAKYRFSQL